MEFPSFDVFFPLAPTEIIEKQQQTSKQTTNIKVKINAKNKDKDGLPPNKC